MHHPFYHKTKIPKHQKFTIGNMVAAGLWIAGYNSGGTLRLFSREYLEQETYPGPLDPATGFADPLNCENWDQIFEIEKWEIDALKLDYIVDGTLNQPPSQNILGWPATGNPFFESIHGFQLPESTIHLAPFWDNNQDGIYNPYHGDYPLVKGDKAMWTVHNDTGSEEDIHNNPWRTPIHLEFQTLVYQYSRDQEYLNNTTFFEFKIIHRGTETLTDTYFSLWANPELGFYQDDHFGIDTTNQLAFIYNADPYDDINYSHYAPEGYGLDIPLAGVKVLKPFNNQHQALPFSSFTYFHRHSWHDMGPDISAPNTNQEYYNYMTGFWRDGQSFTLGERGRAGSTPYPFAFDGTLIEGKPWRMCNDWMLETNWDFLMNYGPTDFNPGDIFEFAFATLWIPNQPVPCTDFNSIIEEGNAVADYYLQACQELEEGYKPYRSEPRIEPIFFRIRPNPSNQNAIVEVSIPGVRLESVKLYHINGRLIREWNSIQASFLNINTHFLATGTYIVEIQTDNGLRKTKKLIIQ